MKHELSAWLLNNDSVSRYLMEVVQKDANSTVSGEDLYLSYSDYSDECGERPMGRYKFYNRLQELGYTRQRSHAKGDRKYYWQGIKIPVTDFN